MKQTHLVYMFYKDIYPKQEKHKNHLHCAVQDNNKWLNYVTMVQTVVLYLQQEAMENFVFPDNL